MFQNDSIRTYIHTYIHTGPVEAANQFCSGPKSSPNGTEKRRHTFHTVIRTIVDRENETSVTNDLEKKHQTTRVIQSHPDFLAGGLEHQFYFPICWE